MKYSQISIPLMLLILNCRIRARQCKVVTIRINYHLLGISTVYKPSVDSPCIHKYFISLSSEIEDLFFLKNDLLWSLG
jgi:hypothetical protein